MRWLKFIWYVGLGQLFESLILLPLCILALLILGPIIFVMNAWYKANGYVQNWDR